MKMTDKYPNECPKVRMRTKNISYKYSWWKNCVDYLNNWKSENNIVGIWNAIFTLLATPNPSDGYHQNNGEEVKKFTQKYAIQLLEYKYDEYR